MVKIIESEEEYKTVTQSGGLVVVDFFAEWCGPCKAMAPVLDIMSQKMEGRVTFVKVNGISGYLRCIFGIIKSELRLMLMNLKMLQ